MSDAGKTFIRKIKISISRDGSLTVTQIGGVNEHTPVTKNDYFTVRSDDTAHESKRLTYDELKSLGEGEHEFQLKFIPQPYVTGTRKVNKEQ